MTSKLTRSALAVFCIGLAALAGPRSAHATLTLTLQSGATTLTITDNVSPDAAPALGTIVWSGVFAGFDVESDIASSNALSGLLPAQITINNLSITSNSAGAATLTVTVQDNGFTAPGVGPASVSNQLATTQLPSNVTVNYSGFVNGTQVGSTLSLNTVDGTTGSGTTSVTSPYTLKSVSSFSVNGANKTVQFTGITTVSPIPEPGTVAMALTGLPVLGLFWVRRRRHA